MAQELHGLLAATGLGSPYVLVGHSFGGIIARRFAVRYPSYVAGMVLIDSSHEDQVRRYIEAEGRWGNPPVTTATRVLKLAAYPLGLRRLLPGRASRTAPAEEAGAARAVELTVRQRRADIREMLLSARSHGSPPGLGALPLTVLTAADRDATWNALQSELAALSTSATHIVAAHGGHFLQLDNPELVSAAIRDMLTRIRAMPSATASSSS
jgi:pimeloyl-ACP methyl ester carboxylesterase